MQQRASGRAALVVVIVVVTLILVIANVAALLLAVQRATGAVGVPPIGELYRLCAPCVIYLAATPVIVGILVALIVERRSTSSDLGPRVEKTPELNASRPTLPSPGPALRLLGLLQQEGRFIDFVNEDIDGYSDAQVGAAVRSIHAGCRKALSERVELQRIFSAEDGSEVVIEPGFDPSAVRLTGNVAGVPPFHGTLQHGGWRATKVSLPQSPAEGDPTIIAPAEVEIP